MTHHSTGARAAAFAVHAFTASGALCGVLSLLAIQRGDWRTCLLWGVVAVFIDGVDGGFARLARVKEVLPNFDGALLDNIVDYLNYVIVPAMLIHSAGVLPHGTELLAVSCMALSSAYQFCQADAKTADHYFKGFPSYWNVGGFYVLVLSLSAWVNLALIVALAILVFVPIKYLYPSRASKLRRTTLVLTVLWCGLVAWMVWAYPAVDRWMVGVSLLYVGYYVGASVYCTQIAA